MSNLRKCPFCGEEVKAEYPYLDYLKNLEIFMLAHYCPHGSGGISVGVSVYGKTEKEVIDKWNGVYEE